MPDTSDQKKSPEEVWRLIQTADNFLKYGDDARSRNRARKRFLEALDAAQSAELEALVQQVKVRLADLDRLDEASGKQAASEP